jgi:hypothetical protein
MPVEGSAAEKVRGVGSTMVGAVPGMSAQGAAGSHNVAPVLGMAEQSSYQSWRTGLRSQLLCGVVS